MTGYTRKIEREFWSRSHGVRMSDVWFKRKRKNAQFLYFSAKIHKEVFVGWQYFSEYLRVPRHLLGSLE